MLELNGKNWQEALISGANSIINNKARINALNVFPVPDGDTGSNMASTAEKASNEIKNLTTIRVDEISKVFAKGMLFGARGNSGVILSQIFKGFAIAFETKKVLNSEDIIKGFEEAKNYAYKSVMKPIEGTILTVIRLTAEELRNQGANEKNITKLFELATSLARKACNQTPNMLPVLKEVGVTDSGGEGLISIFEGIRDSLLGKPVTITKQVAVSKEAFFDTPEDWNGEFGYCTEFVIELKNHKNFKKDKFELALDKMGSSIVVILDDNIVKAHIHTLKPGNVFNLAQKHGELLTLKSDNMTLQANESSAMRNEKPLATLPKKTNAKIEVISCNVGQGIINDMKEYGASFIIEGGQSMNPSASDFIVAIQKLKANEIIILPNNSNVILVAQQVAQTIKNKKIIIVPTKTQMEGIAAIINFDNEGTMEENHERMKEAISTVKTGQVTQAVRSTKIYGFGVKKGDFLAISNHKIIKSETSKIKAAKSIFKKLINDEVEVITIYYGDNTSEVEAKELVSFLESNYDDIEIELKDGSQPIYNFLISVE